MLGIRTVTYKVSNLKEAKNWYSKAFDKAPYFDEKFYVGFNIEGYELGLSPETITTQKTDNSISYWGVKNIQETFHKLIKLGATKHKNPNDVGGDILVASVKDPWNNVIGLIYNPHFKLP